MIINKKRIFDIIQSAETLPLESDVEIEDMILAVKDIDDKISFLERLKKERTKTISEEIDKLSLRKDKFKDVISKTLEKFNHKALNFPGVGRVTSKISSEKWKIVDEDALISSLKNLLGDSEFSEVVVQKQSIVKKELNRVLDILISEGKSINFAIKEDGEASLTISYDKNNTNKIDTDEYVETLSTNLENYDSLDEKVVDF